MQTFWRITALAVATVAVLLVSPDRAAAQNAAPAKSGDYFNFLELNVYGGWGNYAKQAGQPFSQLQQGGVMGARITENIWNYFALEQDFGFFSYHRLAFHALQSAAAAPRLRDARFFPEQPFAGQGNFPVRHRLAPFLGGQSQGGAEHCAAAATRLSGQSAPGIHRHRLQTVQGGGRLLGEPELRLLRAELADDHP